jgi:hypothetical protein
MDLSRRDGTTIPCNLLKLKSSRVFLKSKISISLPDLWESPRYDLVRRPRPDQRIQPNNMFSTHSRACNQSIDRIRTFLCKTRVELVSLLWFPRPRMRCSRILLYPDVTFPMFNSDARRLNRGKYLRENSDKKSLQPWSYCERESSIKAKHLVEFAPSIRRDFRPDLTKKAVWRLDTAHP